MEKQLTGWELEDKGLILAKSYATGILNPIIKDFLKNYPLSAISSDFSTLVVIRKCRVQYWEGERRVFPVEPNTEDFHWGIGIAKCKNVSGCVSGTTYLPNKYEYIGVQIEDNIIIIQTTSGSKKITFEEIDQLTAFWRVFDETGLEAKFDLLTNNK